MSSLFSGDAGRQNLDLLQRCAVLCAAIHNHPNPPTGMAQAALDLDDDIGDFIDAHADEDDDD